MVRRPRDAESTGEAVKTIDIHTRRQRQAGVHDAGNNTFSMSRVSDPVIRTTTATATSPEPEASAALLPLLLLLLQPLRKGGGRRRRREP